MEKNEQVCSYGEKHDADGTNKLTKFIWENLRAYSKDVSIDRHTMANALFQICCFFFVVHSPQGISGKLEEIENFWSALKENALNEASTMQ